MTQTVSAAVASRRSIRRFLPDPVDPVRELGLIARDGAAARVLLGIDVHYCDLRIRCRAHLIVPRVLTNLHILGNQLAHARWHVDNLQSGASAAFSRLR